MAPAPPPFPPAPADDLDADGPDRYDLQARWLTLTREVLPARARAAADAGKVWPVRLDHCFMRIALDQLFQGCWYDHLDRRLRAYKQLDDDQLAQAVALAEQLVEAGSPLVAAWNRQSLSWRGKGGPRRR